MVIDSHDESVWVVTALAQQDALPPEATTITIAGISFDHHHYDERGDVLYLNVGQPRPAARGLETPDGHAIHYDETGAVIGLNAAERSSHTRTGRQADPDAAMLNLTNPAPPDSLPKERPATNIVAQKPFRGHAVSSRGRHDGVDPQGGWGPSHRLLPGRETAPWASR